MRKYFASCAILLEPVTRRLRLDKLKLFGKLLKIHNTIVSIGATQYHVAFLKIFLFLPRVVLDLGDHASIQIFVCHVQGVQYDKHSQNNETCANNDRRESPNPTQCATNDEREAPKEKHALHQDRRNVAVKGEDKQRETE